MALLANILMLPQQPVVSTYNTLAQATTGVLTLSVAGGVGTTALTDTQAANTLLKFTGALTGNRTITCPAREKPYWIHNNTTGAFSLTFKTAAGTGATITQLAYAFFMCDGTNAIKILDTEGAGGTLSGLTANRIPYTTSANSLGTDALYWDAPNNFLGIRSANPEAPLHATADGAAAAVFVDSYVTGTGGSSFLGRHARGTAAAPEYLVEADGCVSLTGNAWARNAANTADEWIMAGRLRIVVDSVDAQNRTGGRLEFYVSAGVSATAALKMILTRNGNLLLGASSEGTAAEKGLSISGSVRPTAGSVPADTVVVSEVDLDGVAGQGALYIDTESAVSHAFANEVMLQQLANGQSVRIRSKTALTTIAAAATTDTTITIPADAQVQMVCTRVTVAIPTATTFDIGVAGATTRYGTGISTAANTTSKGTNDGLRYYAASTAIRITPNATPANNNGRLRTTIFYWECVPATS